MFNQLLLSLCEGTLLLNMMQISECSVKMNRLIILSPCKYGCGKKERDIGSTLLSHHYKRC